MDEHDNLEKFYVYRSLHSDESWGAVLLPGDICRLPNIAFGMKVYAISEKEAISKAKQTYDKIHIYDNDKKNIREFVKELLVSAPAVYTDNLNEIMSCAVEMNEIFKKHFKELEQNNER